MGGSPRDRIAVGVDHFGTSDHRLHRLVECEGHLGGRLGHHALGFGGGGEQGCVRLRCGRQRGEYQHHDQHTRGHAHGSNLQVELRRTRDAVAQARGGARGEEVAACGSGCGISMRPARSPVTICSVLSKARAQRQHSAGQPRVGGMQEYRHSQCQGCVQRERARLPHPGMHAGRDQCAVCGQLRGQ